MTEETPEVPDAAEAKGFMLYDLTERRFVGTAISSSKRDAEKSVERVDGHRYETRQV